MANKTWTERAIETLRRLTGREAKVTPAKRQSLSPKPPQASRQAPPRANSKSSKKLDAAISASLEQLRRNR